MQLWTHFINSQKHTDVHATFNKMITCVEAFVQARSWCIRVLSKASSAVANWGGPNSVDGQCCNIHSPNWVLQTETFWASLKMLLLLQWSAGFMQLAQFTALVVGAVALVEAVILLKSSVYVHFINLFVALHAMSLWQFVTWCGLSLVQYKHAVCRLSGCV
jgi:hypothetical protein